MKSAILLTSVMLAAVALSGCASLQGGGQAILQNLQGCERHYNGVVAAGLTGGSFSGSVKIDCPTGVSTPSSTPPAP